MKPRLLDLFCGAGGAAMGYHRAGFEVVGVDIKPQPNYPFEFVQASALGFLDELLHRRIEGGDELGFDAIHASPPCQLFSTSTVMHDRSKHVDRLTPLRPLLEEAGLPYVIENVPGAPLIEPARICGSGLGMVRLRRHRLFESNVALMGVPCAHGQNKDIISVVGHSEGNGRTGPGYLYSDKCAAMRIDWMNRDELSQAIPPDYTELIGHQLIAHIPKRTPAVTGALLDDRRTPCERTPNGERADSTA